MTDHDRFDRPLARAARPHGREVTARCLDAGTLAAWTDGTLQPEERAAAEAHVADCGRCLELVATMAKTEPPPSVPVRASWFSVRWLAPLTAAAVAVMAWILVRDPRIVTPPALQEIARAPEPPPSVSTLPSSEATKQAVPETRPARAQRRDVRERDARERKEDRPAASAAADAAAAKRTTDSLAREAGPPEGTAAARPAPPAAAPPSFRAEAARENVAQLQAGAAGAPRLVPSTDPAVQWRLSGRSIEKTTDGGRTWHTQATADADLLAGASPAPGTCWVVGRSGLVMLSTDGQTWRTLPPPDRGLDLAAVTATDALSAVVTGTDGRTYRTSDGGRTWTLQEIPSAPF